MNRLPLRALLFASVAGLVVAGGACSSQDSASNPVGDAGARTRADASLTLAPRDDARTGEESYAGPEGSSLSGAYRFNTLIPTAHHLVVAANTQVYAFSL